MASMGSSYGRIGLPNWYGEDYNASQLIPGGAIFDKSLITPDLNGKRRILGGTLVGRTQVEVDAGAKFGLFAAGDTDSYLILFDNDDLDFKAEIDMIRPGIIIKSNWLPNWSTLSAVVKSEIQRRYQCILGAPSTDQ